MKQKVKRIFPRYPIYVPSKSRHDCCLTARFLLADGVPFKLVVEPQQRALYAQQFGDDTVLVLPFGDAGSVVPARNWIKAHAAKEGHARHWQLDDNIKQMKRWWNGRRVPCSSGVALAVIEDFVDRYENVAVAGPNYTFFSRAGRHPPRAPFWLNVHVYSCSLVLNSLLNEWRGKYNEDTDICLQVLSDGWCTLLMNAFLIQKLGTMTVKGGNTDALYGGDGRLKMARSLERLWPGVVETKRRFGRPQHVVKDAWQRFDTKLKLKPGLKVRHEPDEYGMVLRQKSPEVRSDRIRKLLEDNKRLVKGTIRKKRR